MLKTYILIPFKRNRLMTGKAIQAELRLAVAGITGLHKIAGMATETAYCQAAEFIALLINMAGLTVGDGVGAGQRESAGSMQLKMISLILPTDRRVAGGAIQAELRLVDIGMAIGAGTANRRKLRTFMAGHAIQFAMGAAQQESGVGVAKVRRRLQLRPGLAGMTAHTIPADLTVRINRAALLRDKTTAQQA